MKPKAKEEITFHTIRSSFYKWKYFFIEWIYFSWDSYHGNILFCFIVPLGITLKLATYKVYVAIRNKAYTTYPEAFA